MAYSKITLVAIAATIVVLHGNCSKSSSGTAPTTNPVVTPVTGPTIETWLTKGDQSMLLQKQSTNLVFSKGTAGFPTITVDSATGYQSVDGFGYTLTGSSAYHINRMSAASRSALLAELFGNGGGSVGISYLRVSMGASDLSPSVFSYNDLPAGQTDVILALPKIRLT
jgi:glucosylceramidase